MSQFSIVDDAHQGNKDAKYNKVEARDSMRPIVNITNTTRAVSMSISNCPKSTKLIGKFRKAVPIT
jgi:hypothetical protein